MFNLICVAACGPAGCNVCLTCVSCPTLSALRGGKASLQEALLKVLMGSCRMWS